MTFLPHIPSFASKKLFMMKEVIKVGAEVRKETAIVKETARN